MGIGSLIGGVVGSVLGGGGKASSSTTVNNTTTQNPYQDDWIHDRFGQGQSQLDELTAFMNERKAALAAPKYYDIGGGQSIRQDQFGEYIQNQLNTKTGDLNRRLTEYQTGVDQSIGQLGQQGQRARDQLMSTYDARLADISAAAGNRNQLMDARLADISTAAGNRDQQLAALQQAGGQRDARLAEITSAAGANEAALRAQSEALALQGERARAGQEANRQALQAATQRNQEALQQATSQYQAGQAQNQAAIQQQQASLMAQQEAMAQQTEASRAAQEQNQITQGVKANIKPKNLYRYGTGGSFNRAGLRISSLNI